ncbi:MAG: methyltransferase domain-containing protein [Chloroflexota bacterium]|nr:methyltransferase domain-containing protein [Chloroflexota bacterium]
MARYLLAVWPYSGHVHPNITLANALRDRGHDVAFYTGALVDSQVTGQGFRRFPFRRTADRIAGIVGLAQSRPLENWDVPELYERLSVHYTAVFDQGALAQAELVKAMYRDWFAGSMPHQVSDLGEILADWQPDVVVCDPFMWGPTLILREIQSTPVVVFSYFAGCLLPGPDVPPFGFGLPSPRNWWSRLLTLSLYGVRDLTTREIAREVDRIRADNGLSPLSTRVMAYTGQVPLYLVASAVEFDFNRRDLPASVHYVGPFLWDKPGKQLPPSWLQQMGDEAATGGDPIVYVSEGSAHTREPVLLRAAMRGLAERPMQVVMTTGRHREPEDLGLGPVAANIRVEQWVPHSDLFPETSAVVTNGGSGTVLSALLAGVPLVVVPMQWDHLENAQRVVEAGAGLRISPGKCTPERLQAAVERVLNEPSFRLRAQEMGSTFKQYGGPDYAVDLLEKLRVSSETRAYYPMNNGIEFTGERVVPGKTPTYLVWAHTSRYQWIKEQAKGRAVLDAGCGEGYGAAYLAQVADRVVGVDLSLDAVEHARTFYGSPSLSFSVMDCSQLSFPSESFDMVSSFEVIEHLTDVDQFLAGVHRVLKPGGVFFVSTPNGGLNINAGKNPFHETEYTLAEYRELLSAFFPDVQIYGQVCTHRLRESLFMYSTNLYMRSKVYEGLVNSLAPLYFKGQEREVTYDPNWVDQSDSGTFDFSLDSVGKATYFVAVCRKAPD